MNFTTEQKIKILGVAGYTVKYEDYICYATDYWQQDSTKKVYQLYDSSGKKIEYDFDNVGAEHQMDSLLWRLVPELLAGMIIDHYTDTINELAEKQLNEVFAFSLFLENINTKIDKL